MPDSQQTKSGEPTAAPPSAASKPTYFIHDPNGGKNTIKFAYHDDKITVTPYNEYVDEKSKPLYAPIDIPANDPQSIDKIEPQWNLLGVGGDAGHKAIFGEIFKDGGKQAFKYFVENLQKGISQTAAPSGAPTSPSNTWPQDQTTYDIKVKLDDKSGVRLEFKDGKLHATVLGDDGKSLQKDGKDVTYDSEATKDVGKKEISDLVNDLSVAQKMALISTFTSGDKAQESLNALAKGDKDKLPDPVKNATAPDEKPATTQLSSREQWLKDISDTGVYSDREVHSAFDLASDERIKKYHEVFMSITNNYSLSDPNAKRNVRNAADSAAKIVDPKHASHTAEKFDGLTDIAKLLNRPGSPDLMPMANPTPGTPESDYNYFMGRLSANSIDAFKDSLEKTAKATNGIIPPGKMKQAIDDAKKAAIDAGEAQAKNQSGADYLKPGQTAEFLGKAFDSNNYPVVAALTADPASPAGQTASAAPASGPPTSLTPPASNPSAASNIPAANGTAPSPWPGTASGSIPAYDRTQHHGRHYKHKAEMYGFTSGPQTGTIYTDNHGFSGNEDALDRKNRNSHAADGTASQLERNELDWFRTYPGQPMPTGTPQSTAPAVQAPAASGTYPLTPVQNQPLTASPAAAPAPTPYAALQQPITNPQPNSSMALCAPANIYGYRNCQVLNGALAGQQVVIADPNAPSVVGNPPWFNSYAGYGGGGYDRGRGLINVGRAHFSAGIGAHVTAGIR